MTTVFDLFIINILWIIFCLPIITIGPSTAAMFYTLMERLRGSGGYIHKDFFHSFKVNLKQGMLLGIPTTLIGVFLVLDMYLCYNAGRGIYSFFFFFFGVFLIFWAFFTLYIFPLLGCFERTTKQFIVWAFTLSIKNLPRTILMWVVILAGLFICRYLPALLFIMFGLLGQFCAVMMFSIFKPYMPDPEEDDLPEPEGNSGNAAENAQNKPEYDINDKNIQDLM